MVLLHLMINDVRYHMVVGHHWYLQRNIFSIPLPMFIELFTFVLEFWKQLFAYSGLTLGWLIL